MDAYYMITTPTDLIKVQAGEHAENLLFDDNITVTLKGGYDCSFIEPPVGTTVIIAENILLPTMIINNGTVLVDGIALR